LFLLQEETMTKEIFMSYVFYDKLQNSNFNKVEKFFNLLFDVYDIDGSGQLTFEEYIVGKKLFESEDIKDNIRFIFLLLDISHDKKIERNEIVRFLDIMNSCGAELNSDNKSNIEFAKKMMDDFDLDKSGYLDEEEFINGIAQNKEYVSFIKSIKS
jgi:hypothetical protein